jgi:heterodisulfide reductase subunit C
MTIRITKTNKNSLPGLVKDRSGVDLNACLQCKKCSSGCPVAGLSGSAPSDIIRRLKMGDGDELLKSDLVWLCLSCGTCQARCPMTINFPAVIDALRALAVEIKAPVPKGDMPRFNRQFLRTVRSYGRAYDLSAIIGYKIGTMTFTRDSDKLPAMMTKGKIALLPPTGADKRIVRRIFSTVEQDKEAGE